MPSTPRHPFLPITSAAILLCLFSACAAFAQAPPATAPTSQPTAPQITYVGIFINDIHGLDLKDSAYIVDFYIWLRWHGNIDPSNFEFLNGALDLKEHPYRMDVNGTQYLSYHCRGTFHIAFDYRDYPLDEHQLILELEDGIHESKELQYVVDADNMKNLPPVTLSGWTCGQPTFEIRQHTYQTNFGYPNEPPGGTSTYSRFNCSIKISRHSGSIFIKTFLGLFISVAIAFLSFLFKPGETDPRFAVGVAAIFGAVSSEIVATGNLPDMPYLTLADKIHFFSLFMIFLSLLQSCLSLRLFREGNSPLAHRLDRISLFAFPISYALVVLLLTVLR
jgi:hypothetical protein